jgi:two-component system, OmpR family, response regulator
MGVFRGRVLIIEADEWLAALLGKSLGDAGYEVHFAAGAKEGFDRVRELSPDCILCDVNLPDIDGFWVARRVRTEATAVATTPFLFLTEQDDTESRLQGLNVGADLYLSKPLRNEEVVAQVGALIEMAKRLKKQREGFSSEAPPSSRASAFQGDIAHVSISTVLTLLELERRTGLLRIKTQEGKRAELELADGTFVRVTLDGKAGEPAELLRAVLRWKHGTFAFKPAGNQPEPFPKIERASVGALLLRAMQLEDEAER